MSPSSAVLFWLAVLASDLAPTDLQAQPSSLPLPHLWRTDGPVRALTVISNTVYLGGDFTYVGPATGGFGMLDPASGTALGRFPWVDGSVYSAVPDNAGGWFIAGDFTSVGEVLRANIAHLLADNSVDPSWAPAVSGSIETLLTSGDMLYLGGEFTKINGQTRNRIAALVRTTGELTAWNPNANQLVNALVASGSNIYAGGNFSTIGGKSRTRLACLDTETGLATDWSPGANNAVSCLALSGSTLYVGGSFTTAGTKPRNRLAAFDLTSNVALNWNPNAGAPVNALTVVGNTVYVGGQFVTISGQNRKYLAALDAATGMATAWDPSPNAQVTTLTAAGSYLFAGGAFLSIGGQSRNSVARFDSKSGELNSWSPRLSKLLQDQAPTSSLLVGTEGSLLVAGNFASLGGVTRTNLAALDTVTGEAREWNPNANGPVTALTADATQVYVGGTFTAVGGVPRARLAAIHPTTGLPTDWIADVTGRSTIGLFALLAGPADRLFVGGNFTNIAGQARNSIAALSRVTAQVLPWNPNAQASAERNSASVRALVVTDQAIYAGGDFVTIGGESRTRLAALDPVEGTALAWSPTADNTVNTLALFETNLYVGGLFDNVGGMPRSHIAALDIATGTPSPWNPEAGGGTGTQVRSMLVAGSSVYAVGQFSQLGGEFRNRVAGVNLASGQAHNWNPNLDGQVHVVGRTPEMVFVGGDFTSIGGQALAYFAAFSALPSFVPGTVHRHADGTFGATLETGEGHQIVVQATEDLKVWTNLQTNAITGFSINFEHAGSAGASRLFYRAMLEAD